ncbi:D-serine ammonia-lyase [Acidovorax sp. PRC11]|uniref:D-serine ammonia-lyase n=1 Tax=Acidovorax sp. PRC11 TaxID=2962592 RepID=UPI00288254F4|nr:D-serine ammonia-lyase [Acidovorax sp. PRC11]MDT0138506.1 D-serine ammonia-lyase [Acidovorax sp. PRC11]
MNHSTPSSTEIRAPSGTLPDAVRHAEPCLWLNPDRLAEVPAAMDACGQNISLHDTQAAASRFGRFAPLLARLFPELQASDGIIESPLTAADPLAPRLGLAPEQGRLWIKADHGLPVAGSIKARGGIHEVLEFAEALALREGLVTPGGDYRALAGPAARAVFARHQVAVGSTGNLGLSIGVAASALGFRAAVHMSADAKEWKKERLRQRGVEVVEHMGDYERAVAAGRAQAAADPFCHFVDDERSLSLLLGYSAAALRLQDQLREQGFAVDAEHPLFVYLPCGVGGAPAGIAFGLRQLLGPHVHCFFAEPVQSPCFLVQMAAPEGTHPSVYDIGLTNRTEADGLAVPRASLLAARLMRPLLSGVFTVRDDTLFEQLVQVLDATGERIEPSAAAGFGGPALLTGSESGRRWLQARGLEHSLPQATHLVWTTGGLFVPEAEHRGFEARGRALLAARR